ncbi:MAG: hypothetical protein CVV12_02865 [Gammaproteobacteria bacterium HGW-Gammaproteobacteria-2]|nr:MAG: hypothetical protein CVV12_02865 [Gammaproteobacteria bacterium HGW-Gammaproteobacteria-2]
MSIASMNACAVACASGAEQRHDCFIAVGVPLTVASIVVFSQPGTADVGCRWCASGCSHQATGQAGK